MRYTDDEERFGVNRSWWDERVAAHVAGEFYDVDGFLAGRSTLRPFEVTEMGEVNGASLVHLQCHFGLDTLSWAREGARVTGVDFSANAVTAARDLADRAGIPADFTEASVYDAVAALDGRTFDVVYTGIGAIIWLPDLTRWAGTVAALLAPGGRFYMAETHPFSVILGEEDLAVTDSYFDPGPFLLEEPGSYAAPDAQTAHRQSLTWHHGLGAVISALARAGLRIELLHEHPYALLARFPFLERKDDRTYHMPAGQPQVPLLYSVKATRPGAPERLPPSAP
jgi:SAM-dependent methyltransferase